MRRILSVLACGLWLVGAPAAAAAQKTAPPIPVKVYKTPTCGCCQKWVDHLKANGFAPVAEDLPSLGAIKEKSGVPADLQSCHTALVQGYVVEGHVPADVIHRLLKEKPKVAGISVPGMPIGSPGMEQGSRKDPYEVIAFTRDGKTSVYEKR